MPAPPAAAASRVFAATLGAAVSEVQTQQALGEGAIGRGLVMRRIVRTDAGRDAVDDRIVIWPEKERDRVARGAVAVDDAVGCGPEAVVRVARQHRPGVDDKGPGHCWRTDPLALGRAHLETRQCRLRKI